MKINVAITVERRTTYTTTVPMTKKQLSAYRKRLEGNYKEQRECEDELNEMIDTQDWQDDILMGVTGIEEVE